MTDTHSPPDASPPPHRSFGLIDRRPGWEQIKHHLPPWKRKLLGLSLVIAILGFGGQITSKVLRHNTPTASAPVTPTPRSNTAPPVGGSGFVSGNTPAQPDPYATPAPSATPAPAPESHTITDAVTPWMGKLGISFFAGIVIGTVARTFVKLAAIAAVGIGGVFAALSYFHVLNVDMTSMKTRYASATEWVEDQGGKLKDVALGALPSSTSAMAGFFAGFKRR